MSYHACTHMVAYRLMCSTYLTFFMRDDLLDEMPLYPYPDPSTQGGSGDANSEVFMAPSVSYSYDQAMTGVLIERCILCTRHRTMSFMQEKV